MRYAKKLITGIIIALLLPCLLAAGVAAYTGVRYLYTPWSFPWVLEEEGVLRFDACKKPVRVYVTYWGDGEDLYPENERLYDECTKQLIGYCERIVTEQTAQSPYNFFNYDGDAYRIYPQSGYAPFMLWISKEPGYVRISNIEYSIPEALHREIIEYIQSTYTVSELYE